MKKVIVWMLAFMLVFGALPFVRAESLPAELLIQSYGYSRDEASDVPPTLNAEVESETSQNLDACDHVWVRGDITGENLSGGTVTIRYSCAFCGQMQDRTHHLASTDARTENEQTIYTLDGWAEEYLEIPAGCSYALRLKVGNSTNVTCRIISGDSVTLTSSGLIIPGQTVYYWYRSGSYMVGYPYPMPDLELVRISSEANFGDSVVEIQSGSQRYQMTIHVEDYCNVYTNQVVDAYIAENITNGMTVPQKMDAICRMPASYNYSASYSSAAGMVVSGGGDCWASTSLILMICEKLGLEAIARNGNRDYGAGSGHMNALVIIGEGDYYELEAGYNQSAPRDYHVSHRTSLLCYRYSSSGLTIYQYDGSTDANTTLVIPDAIEGTPVVALEEGALRYGEMGGIVLPETLQIIGEQALAGCSNLTSIHIPASVTRIDTMAFTDCGSLTEITCSPENPAFCAQDGVIYNKDKTLLVSAPACGSVQLPETLERIGTYAFYYNPNVEELILPDSVHTLESAALANCAKLKKVVFQGVESVEDFAFTDNNGLSVYALGDAPAFTDYSFYRSDVNVCYNRNGAGWDDAVTGTYEGTVTWTPVSGDTVIAEGDFGALHWAITADQMLTITGSGAMKHFEGRNRMPWYSLRNLITSVNIQSGITSIGDFAFYGCSNLTDISIPESVTAIGNYAFRNCISLEHVDLPSRLAKLGESSFYACTGLQSIDIPASLWTIQPYTFKNCENLTSVTFHEGNLEKISDGAFYGTGLTELVLPDCLDILDVYAFKGCADLESITIGSGLDELCEAVFYGTAINEIIIPEGITKIGPYAFKNCVELEAIDLPSTLTSVGEASFYADTALKVVELPVAVTEIGNYAFRKCESIETLILSEELVTIGECAFYGCTGLTELVIPDQVTTIKPYAFKTCTGLTSVTLGNSVQSIGEGAFNTCTGLKTIVFPASLKVIGDYAFANSENLWKLTFLGDAPTIGTGAFKGLNACAYYPAGNASWTAEKMLNYGGKIEWVAN